MYDPDRMATFSSCASFALTGRTTSRSDWSENDCASASVQPSALATRSCRLAQQVGGCARSLARYGRPGQFAPAQKKITSGCTCSIASSTSAPRRATTLVRLC